MVLLGRAGPPARGNKAASRYCFSPAVQRPRCAACADYPVPRGRGLVCVTGRAGEKEEKKKHGPRVSDIARRVRPLSEAEERWAGILSW